MPPANPISLEMTAEDYINQRLLDQYEFYEGRSSSNKKTYYRLRTIELVAAALIPLLSGLTLSDTNYKFWLVMAVAALGTMITIIAGVLSLKRYQENWIEYRKTAESLKREQIIFATQSPPYDADNREKLLVQNVELILSKENANWSQTMLQPIVEKKPPELPRPMDAPKPPKP